MRFPRVYRGRRPNDPRDVYDIGPELEKVVNLYEQIIKHPDLAAWTVGLIVEELEVDRLDVLEGDLRYTAPLHVQPVRVHVIPFRVEPERAVRDEYLIYVRLDEIAEGEGDVETSCGFLPLPVLSGLPEIARDVFPLAAAETSFTYDHFHFFSPSFLLSMNKNTMKNHKKTGCYIFTENVIISYR